MKKKLFVMIAAMLVVATGIAVLVGCTGVSSVFAEQEAPLLPTALTRVAALDGTTFNSSLVSDCVVVKKGAMGSEKFALYNAKTDTVVKDFTDYSDMREANNADFGLGVNIGIPDLFVAKDRAASQTAYLFDAAGTELAKTTTVFRLRFLRLKGKMYLVEDTNSADTKYYVLTNGVKTADVDTTQLGFNSDIMSWLCMGGDEETLLFKHDNNYVLCDSTFFVVQSSINVDKYIASDETIIRAGLVNSNGEVILQLSSYMPFDATEYTYFANSNKVLVRTLIVNVAKGRVKEVKTKNIFLYMNNAFTSSTFYTGYASNVDNYARFQKIEDKRLSTYETKATVSNSLKIGTEFDDIIDGYAGKQYVASDRVIVIGESSAALCKLNGSVVTTMGTTLPSYGSYGKFFAYGNSVYSTDNGNLIYQFAGYTLQNIAGDTFIVAKDGKSFSTSIETPTALTELTDYQDIGGIYCTKSGTTYSYYSGYNGAKLLDLTTLLSYVDGDNETFALYMSSDNNVYRLA